MKFTSSFITALCLSVAAPTAAVAYVRMGTTSGTPLAWQRACPSFVLMTGGPAELPAGVIAEILETSRRVWQEEGCAQPPVSLEPGPAQLPVSYDGVNALVYRPPEHCADPANAEDEVCLSPNAAAVTTMYYYSKGDRAGEVIEVDMEVNGDFPFDTGGASERYDLPTVLAHELGHAFGLDHTCNVVPGSAPARDSAGRPVPSCFPLGNLPAEIRQATMFPYVAPGETSRRVPTADERAALCEIYGGRGDDCVELKPGCGCGAAGASGFAAVVAASVAWLFAWSRARRRRR